MEFSFNSAGVAVPCGLWQEVHVILPSRTGMWELRICSARCRRWQVPHVSISVAFVSWWRFVMSFMTV